jgi:hypothetical protein
VTELRVSLPTTTLFKSVSNGKYPWSLYIVLQLANKKVEKIIVWYLKANFDIRVIHP